MSVQLPLTAGERQALRRARVRLAEVATLAPGTLADRTGLPATRARDLVALAAFQVLPSVGPASAGDLLRLGYRSVAQLAGQDPVRMRERLEQLTGLAQDPCVEDVFACAVHAAEHGVAATPPWWTFSRRRLAASATRAGRRPPGPRSDRHPAAPAGR